MRNEKAWILAVFWLLTETVMCSMPAWAMVPVGEARAVSGDVQALPRGSSAWERIGVGYVIQPGDTLRTGPASRVSVLCVDESQIKLGENTLMVFKSAEPSSRLGYQPVTNTSGSAYGLEQGRAWIRNTKEDFRFELSTPAVTAAIRGTEFTVEVDPDGASTISLLQGDLAVFNDFGALDLAAGEMATARPGEAPRKQILVQPEDAVQWILYYPGTGILRAVSLAGLGISTAGPAIRAYDRGDLRAARELALDPARADVGQASIVLGFLALREGRDEDALTLFDNALKIAPEPRAVAGRCLVLYHRGASDQAHIAYSAIPRTAQTPDTLALGGFFALMAGKPEQATDLLDRGLTLAPDHVGCHALRSQIDLAANRETSARAHAEHALSANPDSALALVSAGLTDIAIFDLPQARARMTRAARLDPGFVEPLIYLARLQLGAEHLDEARATLNRALAIAPGEAPVLSMDGFLWLATRHYADAERAFLAAIQADPTLGDPHLGLGLCAYAHGNETSGLREMLTATLLDPRVSQFQSMLGKALFQARAFDKALATFDYASQLDPNDPTPHLYKGIVLTDLNRPGEAIREINTSIAKNDNQAVFRSSLMLDRDLAVRNSDLAKSYSALGLGEWGYSKALTAVKNDPLNFSARYFLNSAFALTRQRTSAGISELLLYRLLSPANQNSFSSLDYTPMFESPYMGLITMGSVGAWSNGNAISSGTTQLSGCVPGFATHAQASVTRDEGLRDSNSERQPTIVYGTVKWEPTVKDALFLNADLHDTLAGDTSNSNDWTYEASRFMDQTFRNRSGEFAYVRRFSPEAALLTYVRQGFSSWDFQDGSFDPAWMTDPEWAVSETSHWRRETSMTSTIVQAQQQIAWNDHTFMAGFDAFRGKFHYDYNALDSYWMSWPGYYEGLVGEYPYETSYSLTQKSLGVYIQDYWKPRDGLVVELGLSADRASLPRHGYSDPVERNFIGTRFGVNWEATERDVLRLAVQKYLNTKMLYFGTLQPADVAGFPTWLSADDGSEILEAGLAWERQWNDLTYTVARLGAYDVRNPQYDPWSAEPRVKDVGMRRYQTSIGLNRILAPSLGLWGGAAFKRLLPNDLALDFSPNTDFSEADLTAGLSYLHESGFGASIGGGLVHQHFSNNNARDLGGDRKKNETFAILNLGCAYAFPAKRGSVELKVCNLFDKHASYELEQGALTPYDYHPARRVELVVFFRF
ncbi:MAG: tetratricopeptide repeat protein [Opitutae bacterium]|nr:tetratricopeptide repeat protein [Opitutae bacterium]